MHPLRQGAGVAATHEIGVIDQPVYRGAFSREYAKDARSCEPLPTTAGSIAFWRLNYCANGPRD